MHAWAALCIVFDDGPQLEGYCRPPYETRWRMITMESDYHLVSHLSLRPLPLPPPSLLPLASLPFSTRGQVSPRLRCQGCQSPTHSECEATVAKETVIRLLGTWSCAHNSHFVAWKHTHARTQIAREQNRLCSLNKFARKPTCIMFVYCTNKQICLSGRKKSQQ